MRDAKTVYQKTVYQVIYLRAGLDAYYVLGNLRQAFSGWRQRSEGAAKGTSHETNYLIGNALQMKEERGRGRPSKIDRAKTAGESIA